MYSSHYYCQIVTQLEHSLQFSKNTQKSDFKEIGPVGAELSMRTDGRIERHDEGFFFTILQFCNFAKAPTNGTQPE
jgi:hypothetical protein